MAQQTVLSDKRAEMDYKISSVPTKVSEIITEVECLEGKLLTGLRSPKRDMIDSDWRVLQQKAAARIKR